MGKELREVEPQYVTPAPPSEGGREGVVVSSAAMITGRCTVVRFNDRAMVLDRVMVPGIGEFTQYVPLHKDRFETIAYPLLGGVSRSRMSDVFAYVVNTAPDVTDQGHLLMMGSRVWNMRTLEFEEIEDTSVVVWRSPWEAVEKEGPVSFVMDLAGGDKGHYEDILQSMAGLVMHKKPDGVMWWVGGGANGKSSLMEAIYRLFPGQLASLTVKGLTDGRDTPMLNGHLANVVKESSEGRIEDTQIYKSIGTHEDFRVHKFHSQESMTIRGNMHHIFSANQVPIFNDKGYSARRRTFIIPFNQVFKSDPTFEERTFTPEVLGHLLWEIMRVARDIQARAYRYKFSQITDSAKMEYDVEANNAEEYARELLEGGIVGFEAFGSVRADYENWCADNGYVPLGVGNMRRSLQQVGFERRSIRYEDGTVSRKYIIKTVDSNDIRPYGYGRQGLYTSYGFVPTEKMKQEEEAARARQEALGDDW